MPYIPSLDDKIRNNAWWQNHQLRHYPMRRPLGKAQMHEKPLFTGLVDYGVVPKDRWTNSDVDKNPDNFPVTEWELEFVRRFRELAAAKAKGELPLSEEQLLKEMVVNSKKFPVGQHGSPSPKDPPLIVGIEDQLIAWYSPNYVRYDLVEGKIADYGTSLITQLQAAQDALHTTYGGTIGLRHSAAISTTATTFKIDRPGVTVYSKKYNWHTASGLKYPYIRKITVDNTTRHISDNLLSGLCFDELRYYCRADHYITGCKVENFAMTPYPYSNRHGIIFDGIDAGYPDYMDGFIIEHGRCYFDEGLNSDTSDYGGLLTFFNETGEAAVISLNDIYVYSDGNSNPFDLIRVRHGSKQGAGGFNCERLHLAIGNATNHRVLHIVGGSSEETRGFFDMERSFWEAHDAGATYYLVRIGSHTSSGKVKFDVLIARLRCSTGGGDHYLLQNLNSQWTTGQVSRIQFNDITRGGGNPIYVGTKGTETSYYKLKIKDVEDLADEDW